MFQTESRHHPLQLTTSFQMFLFPSLFFDHIEQSKLQVCARGLKKQPTFQKAQEISKHVSVEACLILQTFQD